MDSNNYRALLEAQRAYLRSGAQASLAARKASLRALAEGIRSHEADLMEALRLDLGKSPFEAYTNEIAVLHAELAHTLKHLGSWMRPRRIRPEIQLLPSRAEIRAEALGTSLIIAPWNYPINLLLAPLIAALAAGCTALLKPSELSSHSERALARLIADTFDPRQVALVTGGPEVSTALLALPFDKFFFTGSPAVGRLVMRAAAEQLASVTLELGGKSPALVDGTVDLEAAARMIAWGKFNNAGQTCVAPDYVLVEEGVREAFLSALRRALLDFYGEDPRRSPDYGRIINRRHFDRLLSYLDQGRVLVGGEAEAEERYLAPTLLVDVDWDSPVMVEEIFGPILPVLDFATPAEAVELVRSRPQPLALYIFSNDPRTRALWRDSLPFGGGGIHSTILQVASSRLPFGGLGPSGLGSYHGRAGFDAFTHYKSLLIRNPRLEPGFFFPGRQPPLALIRALVGGRQRSAGG